MKNNVLIIVGHPNLQESKVNKAIVAKLGESGNNYRLVQTFRVTNKEYYQQLLLAHDTIVFQFPLYWSSFPAVLKGWIDDIFTEGFSFGRMGSKLEGKRFILSMTAGATEASYQYGGFNHAPLVDYLLPMQSPLLSAQMVDGGSMCMYEASPEKVDEYVAHLIKLIEGE